MNSDYLKQQYYQILQYQQLHDEKKQEIEQELKNLNEQQKQNNYLNDQQFSNNNNINLNSQPQNNFGNQLSFPNQYPVINSYPNLNQYQNLNQNYPNYQQQQQQQQQQQYPSYDEFNQKQNQELEKAKVIDLKNLDSNIPYIVHKVKASDTLAGISIQYDVSENQIKSFNNMETDEIYFKKELKIPNPKCTNQTQIGDDADSQRIIELQKIHYFKNNFLEKDDQKDSVAKYYLSSNDWDTDKANNIYQQDLAFEKQNKQSFNIFGKKWQ